MSLADAQLIAFLALATGAIGVVLGFIGAGGAGVLVALLTIGFKLPPHQAVGTALAVMCFVTISGAVSHYREGNVAPRTGLVTGLAGGLGAVLGAGLSQGIPESALQRIAGFGLLGLALLVWLRTQIGLGGTISDSSWTGETARTPARWSFAAILGLSGGTAAAILGVGMAPYLQLGFLSVLGLPLRQTIGTTMMTLIFISAAGSTALARYGDVSMPHLVGTTIGVSAGAFLGARFTRRAPIRVLRFALVAVPVAAGLTLLLF